MKVVFASSEAVPFAKTGGLADVCGALPAEIERLGHQSALFLPAYRQTLECGQPVRSADVSFEIPIGNKYVRGNLLESRLPKSDVPVYLVEQEQYFDRAELYREAGRDYKDNCERFTFFSRAVLESTRILGIQPHVIHANDWQTGLIPACLALEYGVVPGFQNAVSVMTIHNMAYQGQFWHWDMLLTGIDWKYFNWRQMEFHGHLNLLKTGIVFADAITTVSRRYAQEIQSAPLGCGLEGALAQRRGALTGILNGVDYEAWDPASDEHLVQNYDASNWKLGKAANKAALQQELGLPVRPETPLIGLVGRLADQKGWNLVARVMQRWVDTQDVQWAILGTGEAEYHRLLSRLARQFPEKVAARLEFSNRLAHRIEAGADLFLMPSQYEPCGLNQLYSLRFGTVPVVRDTGGLSDTVTDVGSEQVEAGRVNGFKFAGQDDVQLEAALETAVSCFRRQPERWSQLVLNGMQQDWSWKRSARQYLDLYQETISGRKPAALA